MTDKTDRVASLNAAITRGGGIMAFSRALGVKHQAIYSWKKRGYVPPDKAYAIEALFGVPRAELMAPHMAELLSPPQSAADVI